MAKIVIAGRANCPYYAKIELLADSLAKNLDGFKLHKIVIQPGAWEEWLTNTCKERNWAHNKSPLVWRELIDRGGKGVLIGGANDFQEYAKGYYEVVSNFTSNDMLRIAEENLKTKTELDEEERALRALSQPSHICVTSASGPVSYGLLSEIARGTILGPSTEVTLHLLESEENHEAIEGIRMEVMDLAYPLLRGIHATSDPKEAFKDCSAIVLLDEIEREEDEPRENWLKRNNDFFTNYAKIINEVACKDVKVLVGGQGPVNFITNMMIRNAPDVAPENIVGFCRILENQVKAVIGKLLKVNSAYIVDALVWGNPSSERFIDISQCRVHNFDGAIWGPPFYSRPVKELIYDKKWLEKDFLESVNEREKNLVALLNHKNTASHAAALATLLHHWFQGGPEDQIFSLGVRSEGDFDIPEGLVCSLPVKFTTPGSWSSVKDMSLKVDNEEVMKDKIKACVEDLKSEVEVIYPPTPPPTPPIEEEEAEPTPMDQSEQVFGTEDGQQQTEEVKTEESDKEGNSTTTVTGSTSENDTDGERLAKIEEEKVTDTDTTE